MVNRLRGGAVVCVGVLSGCTTFWLPQRSSIGRTPDGERDARKRLKSNWCT
jgi:hypothetical protein